MYPNLFLNTPTDESRVKEFYRFDVSGIRAVGYGNNSNFY